MARVTKPRGLSLVDLLVGLALVSSICFVVFSVYERVDCSNRNTEPERMLPRLLSLTVERERVLKSRVEVNDCGFTGNGASGDCFRVGLTSNAPTLYAYAAVPSGSSTTVYAIGQDPETYGSVVSLSGDGKLNKSLARCR